MNPPPDNDDEMLTRWIDGQLTPSEASLMEQRIAETPALRHEKDAAARLGELLRGHLAVNLDPPSPEFFTSRIMEETATAFQGTAERSRVQGPSRLLAWIRAPWFAPVASAAAVAVAFIVWNHRPASASGGPVAVTYTPDPRVTASAFYSEEAGATVIDLQNLDAVPDDREIKAFDVASAEPAGPGEPLVLYASGGGSRPVLVLSKDARDTPRITAVY